MSCFWVSSGALAAANGSASSVRARKALSSFFTVISFRGQVRTVPTSIQTAHPGRTPVRHYAQRIDKRAQTEQRRVASQLAEIEAVEQRVHETCRSLRPDPEHERAERIAGGH